MTPTCRRRSCILEAVIPFPRRLPFCPRTQPNRLPLRVPLPVIAFVIIVIRLGLRRDRLRGWRLLHRRARGVGWMLHDAFLSSGVRARKLLRHKLDALSGQTSWRERPSLASPCLTKTRDADGANVSTSPPSSQRAFRPEGGMRTQYPTRVALGGLRQVTNGNS